MKPAGSACCRVTTVVREALPWVRQWHGEFDPDVGDSPTAISEGFLTDIDPLLRPLMPGAVPRSQHAGTFDAASLRATWGTCLHTTGNALAAWRLPHPRQRRQAPGLRTLPAFD